MSAALTIHDVVTLYARRQPSGLATRGNVNKWLRRQGVPYTQAGPKRRLYARRVVLTALAADFPPNETDDVLQAEDAFLLAGRKYPTPKVKVPA